MLYALALAPIGVLPYAMGFASLAYGLISSVCGIGLAACAVATYREREGEAAKHAARRLFWFSIIYLFTLFLVLVVERVLHLTAFTS
jgi:protoheme IX farnesyltransferase